MEVSVVILEFKKHLKTAGYAKNTIQVYSKWLNQFRDYLIERDIKDLRAVTSRIVFDYWEKVMKQPLSQESKALKIRPVKRLFEHLVNTHQLFINPTEGIVETTRIKRKIGIVLTEKEIKRLLAQPNLSTKLGIRDRAIMELLYGTGIRKNEIINLDIYNADLEDKVVYIRKGKGKKQRVVPMGKACTRYVKEYITKIRPYYAKKNIDQRRLFLSISGNPITGNALARILYINREKANIKKPVSPHTLRRTCATHLLQNGADIRYVQELLGHKYLTTTQIYTKVRPRDLKKTHEKTHPFGQKSRT